MAQLFAFMGTRSDWLEEGCEKCDMANGVYLLLGLVALIHLLYFRNHMYFQAILMTGVLLEFQYEPHPRDSR